MIEHHHIIIIGAGLSGIYTATQLSKTQDVLILEARDRIGGRILSPSVAEHEDSKIDMGPAWLWPQLQPRMNQLIQKLDLPIFKQFTRGNMLYENPQGQIQSHDGPSSHGQSYRFTGGAIALINALKNQLNTSAIQLHTTVTEINTESLTISAEQNGKIKHYSADKIILALPLRLLANNINFIPQLPAELIASWNNTSTWMAGHCKAVFIYDTAFWREQNFSGEVFSQRGPMTEIYDASPYNEAFYALTSFIGLNAHQRKQLGKKDLLKACQAQLVHLFGTQAANSRQNIIEDWSENHFTAHQLDINSPAQHPHYDEQAPRQPGNRNIILAGTETAIEHGGYLEGALESAELALKLMNNSK